MTTSASSRERPATHAIQPGAAAGHIATAEAGAEILAAGGGAADAAVAMMLVSCAAETIFTGLGGGGFAIYYDAAAREATCVDFFVSMPGLSGGHAGPGVPIEVIFVGQHMPYDVGPPTVAVPGVPAGAHHLWRRWGRLPWPDVVAPGRRAALGSELPATHATLLPKIAPAMCVGDGVEVYQRPDGSYLQAGDLVRHPDHPQAFDLLAENPSAFYRGDYASAMLDALADGSAMDGQDLAAYGVVESAPRRVQFHGFSVLARGDDLDDVLGTMAHAAETMAADPVTDPPAALALVEALRAPERRSETTNLVAVDADGNACAITSSLGLGSGVWVPGFGVHLNSMLGEGELLRGDLEPGVRMGSMMSPLVALDRHGAPVVLAGAAGGSRIRSALVQSVLRMLNNDPPQQAIDAPRLNALPDIVRLEPGFAESVIEALEQAGNQVLVADHRDAYFGGVSAVGRLGGGADPRRSGGVTML